MNDTTLEKVGIILDTSNEEKRTRLKAKMFNLSKVINKKIGVRKKILKKQCVNPRHIFDKELFRLSNLLDLVEHSPCFPTSSLEQWDHELNRLKKKI